MHAILQFLKTTLLGGVLIILPAWIATLLLLKALAQLGKLVDPVSNQLPQQVNHPRILAFLLLILVCFLIGLALRTLIGRHIARSVENKVLRKLPGYSTLSSVARQMGESQENRGFKPALVDMEDGLAPCFIVEVHPDTRVTVFVPSSPTPAAGIILIIDASRVHPIDVSVAKMFACVSKWGAGSGELLTASRPLAPQPPPPLPV
jgi:uncharacterized membrane protein